MHHLLNRWVIAPVAILAFWVIFFAEPVFRLVSDKAWGLAGSEPSAVAVGDAGSEVRRLVANAAHPVFVLGKPELVSTDAASARYASTLRSFGGAAEYPTLLVTTYGADGYPRRVLKIGPADYQHAGSAPGNAGPEVIQFSVSTREGESRFAVQVNGEFLVWHTGEAAGS